MAFIKEVKAKESESKFKKTRFMQLPSGTVSSVRILNDEAYETYYHYVKGYSIRCLGRSECPICKVNTEIYMQDPDAYRENKSYIASRKRYFVNVLDTTVAKHCEKCGNDVKDTSLVICPKCNNSIATVAAKPINEVRVLSKGPALFSQLGELDGNVKNAQGEVMSITDFGIDIRVSGTGIDTITTAIPDPFVTGEVVLPEGEELFDLEKAIITLEPEEMVDLVSGVQLRDIFVARSSKDEPKEKVATFVGKVADVSEPASAEALQDVSARIDKLFG